MCFPDTRMHFCVSATRFHSDFRAPRKISLNWFIPAFANSNVLSVGITTGDDATISCPFPLKKSRNDCLISADVIIFALLMSCSLHI